MRQVLLLKGAEFFHNLQMFHTVFIS